MTRSFFLLYSVYSTRKRKHGLKEVTIMSATKCATDDVSELFPAVATPPFEDLTCLENYWGKNGDRTVKPELCVWLCCIVRMWS